MFILKLILSFIVALIYSLFLCLKIISYSVILGINFIGSYIIKNTIPHGKSLSSYP
jgi:hypothetical protein